MIGFFVLSLLISYGSASILWVDNMQPPGGANHFFHRGSCCFDVYVNTQVTEGTVAVCYVSSDISGTLQEYPMSFSEDLGNNIYQHVATLQVSSTPPGVYQYHAFCHDAAEGSMMKLKAKGQAGFLHISAGNDREDKRQELDPNACEGSFTTSTGDDEETTSTTSSTTSTIDEETSSSAPPKTSSSPATSSDEDPSTSSSTTRSSTSATRSSTSSATRSSTSATRSSTSSSTRSSTSRTSSSTSATRSSTSKTAASTSSSTSRSTPRTSTSTSTSQVETSQVETSSPTSEEETSQVETSTSTISTSTSRTRPSTSTSTSTSTPATTAGPTPTPGECDTFVPRSQCRDMVCATGEFVGTGSEFLIPNSGNSAVPDQAPKDASKIVSFIKSGISGTVVPSTWTKLKIQLDAGKNAGRGFNVRVSYDFSGDSTWDRVELFKLIATNPIVDFETFNLEASPTNTQVAINDVQLENMKNGRIQLEVWQALPSTTNGSMIVNGPMGTRETILQIPYSQVTTTTESVTCQVETSTRPGGVSEGTRNGQESTSDASSADGVMGMMAMAIIASVL